MRFLMFKAVSVKVFSKQREKRKSSKRKKRMFSLPKCNVLIKHMGNAEMTY